MSLEEEEAAIKAKIFKVQDDLERKHKEIEDLLDQEYEHYRVLRAIYIKQGEQSL